MSGLVRAYLPGRRDVATRVLDVGSLNVNGSYRPLFSDPAWSYVGLDVVPGCGVDTVVRDPYRWAELASEDFDVVVSGQALEHIAYPWRTTQEIARVLRPGGLVFVIAPGAGPEHRHPIDCWRFLPDGLRALAAWAGLAVLEVRAHTEPTGYADGSDQWCDTVMVAAKGAGRFGEEFERRRATWSDVVDHLPRLYSEASRARGSRVIELGVRTGNSTAAFLAAAEAVGGHVWSVDRHWPSVPEWWSRSTRWTCVVGDDLEVADRLPSDVDVIFLDTSHEYDVTRRELSAYLPKVRPGGVMLCHDTDVEQPEEVHGGPAFPVRRAIDEVVAAEHLHCEYVPGCFGLGVIRVPA
jgi:SAM-dependent methyltransferase